MLRRPPRSTLFPYPTLSRFDDAVRVPAVLNLVELSQREEAVLRHALRRRGLWRQVAEQLLARVNRRSEEHTSELQSRQYLVCRLLLEKKKRLPKTNSK